MTGNHFRVPAKYFWKTRPNTSSGTLISSTANTTIARSIHVSRFTAAITPKNSPTSTPKIRDWRPSRADTGSFSRMISCKVWPS